MPVYEGVTVEFGLVLSQFNTKWKHVVADARAAEEHGLDSMWLADHLLAPGAPEQRVFEAWTALAALAGETERVRLGHMVNCVSFRNVGLLAKMAATVDHASAGRLELGLGAGWHEPEYRAFGYQFPTAAARVRAFRETVDAIDLLFAGGPVDYDGEFVHLEGAYCHPTPVQQPRPPLTVGAGGKVMRRFAGERADAWNCPSGLLSRLAEARAVVMEAAGGRRVRTTVQIPVVVGRDEEEAAAAREVAAVDMAWMGEIDGVGLVGTVAAAVERVSEYRALGVDGFICVVPGSSRRPDFVAALGEVVAAAKA